jgi:hypothetical protein
VRRRPDESGERKSGNWDAASDLIIITSRNLSLLLELRSSGMEIGKNQIPVSEKRYRFFS